jgi:hypothetical protein
VTPLQKKARDEVKKRKKLEADLEKSQKELRMMKDNQKREEQTRPKPGRCHSGKVRSGSSGGGKPSILKRKAGQYHRNSARRRYNMLGVMNEAAERHVLLSMAATMMTSSNPQQLHAAQPIIHGLMGAHSMGNQDEGESVLSGCEGGGGESDGYQSD